MPEYNQIKINVEIKNQYEETKTKINKSLAWLVKILKDQN